MVLMETARRPGLPIDNTLRTDLRNDVEGEAAQSKDESKNGFPPLEHWWPQAARQSTGTSSKPIGSGDGLLSTKIKTHTLLKPDVSVENLGPAFLWQFGFFSWPDSSDAQCSSTFR